MANQRDIKGQILATSNALFYKFGFHKVSVDEIASKLGISKKTFYQYFASKDLLVQSVVENNIQELELQITDLISDTEKSCRDKIEMLLTSITSFHTKFSQRFMEDIVKYMPNTLAKMEESGNTVIANHFRELYLQGVAENIFRDDIDPEVIIKIYFHIIEKMHDQEMLAKVPYSFRDIYKMIVTLLFEGMLTVKSR